jgi:HmuY protein
MRAMRRALLCCCLGLLACAPDLRDDFPFDGQLPDGTYIELEDEGGGSTRLVVDATNKTSYVYLDLDPVPMLELQGAAAIESNAWDLSFQRFKISGNGGTSGPGPVEIAVLDGADYDALTQAPADGYQQDATTTVIGGDAEGGWYVYDLSVHKLVPRDRVYVVRSTERAYFKLKMLGYYDEHGTAARLTLRTARLTPP